MYFLYPNYCVYPSPSMGATVSTKLRSGNRANGDGETSRAFGSSSLPMDFRCAAVSGDYHTRLNPALPVLMRKAFSLMVAAALSVRQGMRRLMQLIYVLYIIIKQRITHLHIPTSGTHHWQQSAILLGATKRSRTSVVQSSITAVASDDPERRSRKNEPLRERDHGRHGDTVHLCLKIHTCVGCGLSFPRKYTLLAAA
ncbi:hypothetical protein BDB00DRAFT_547489 [Zychaea mexicana]|uniref:uncharacterized protein n=1 Tax=Zychaea mexicana TaxID=64656 RepID=UPI0022FE0834|nr:uncharacterized protein BDB00DRAFT_547489 [Zychaea mexicana]KAI9497946.1 hypothetical protein BDB00DRAFT_547489 [Zychaea mexicana]